MSQPESAFVISRINCRDGAWLRKLVLAAHGNCPDAFQGDVGRLLGMTTDEWNRRARTDSFAPFAATYIADRDGKVLGFLRVAFPPGGEPVPDIGYLWVFPSFRRQGVGSALVAEAVEFTKGFCSKISVWCTAGHAGTEEFWKHLGFCATGDTRPLREDSKLQAQFQLLFSDE